MHKPIYQDVKEVVVPYRVYVQQIAPVEEYKQTYVPVEKSRLQHSKQSINYPMYSDDYAINHYGYSHGDINRGQRLAASTIAYENEPEASSLSPGIGYSQMIHKNPYMDFSYHIPYRIEELYKKPFVFEEPKYLSMNKFNKYNN